MTDDFAPDEELRARLRAADPAAYLPPADPAGTDRLLEEIMSDNTTTLARPAKAWLVVAAACVLMLGVGLTAVWQPWRGDEPAPTAGVDTSNTAEPTQSTESTEGGGEAVEATRLTVPSVAGRCAVPSAEILGHYETAFRATAAQATDRVITMNVGKVYRGDPGNLVELTGALNRAGTRGNGARDLTGAPVFEPGKEYLIAASGDTIAVCGLSGEVTPEREKLFEDAF